MDEYDVESMSFSPKCRLFSSFSSRCVTYCKHYNGKIIYAPMYIHRFVLEPSPMSAEARKFFERYPDKSNLHTIADKLKYYRHKKRLKQEEVAAIVGLSRSCYMDYEAERNVYPLDKLTAIAKTLDVKVVDLIDNYNVFLNEEPSK